MSPRRAETPPPPNLDPWKERHRELIAELVERQRSAVLGPIAAGAMPEAVWDAEKWDRELVELLTGLALTMSPEMAEPVAEAFGIVHDERAAATFLVVNARYAALSFNARTLEDLNDVVSEIHNNPEPLDDGPVSFRGRLGLSKADPADLASSTRAGRRRLRDAADEVLTAAQERRAKFLADERAAIIANYSRNEAARRGGARTKTWITPHPRPRPTHAGLDNVTIAFEDVFSNGARYPRDATLPAGERAGCTCHVSYTSDDVDPERLAETRRGEPGNFESFDDFREWGDRRGIDIAPDAFGTTPPEPAFLDEIARRVDDIQARFPATRATAPNGSAGLKGIGNGLTQGPNVRAATLEPGTVAVSGPLPDGVPTPGRGVGVWWHPSQPTGGGRPFEGAHTILADTPEQVFTHELGHIIHDTIENTELWSDYRDFLNDTVNLVDDIFGDGRLGSGRVGLMRDVSPYAGANDREAFAELFLAAYDAEAYGRLPSDAARRRVRRFATKLNSQAHLRGLSSGYQGDIFPVPSKV